MSNCADANKTLVGDYSLFLSSWNSPSGGIHGYIKRFLASGDATFQHIAIWTLLQLLESGDRKLVDTIRSSTDIMNMVREISEKTVEEDDATEDSEDGEGEVVALARRCRDIALSGVEGSEDAASSHSAHEKPA